LVASVRGGLRTQIIATLGLTPLTLVFFHQVSVVGFIANLVAIPLVTLVITPLALLGVLFSPLWRWAAWVQDGLASGLTLLGQVPGAVWLVPVAPLWAQWAGLLAAALVVMPLPWRVRLLAVPLVMPLLLPVRDLPAEGQFELMAVDVGQGTAVLVRTRQHLMVYDAGPQYSRESDAGQRVLLPLLRARGEERIDRLVLSHRDLDHVGGAAVLLNNLPVAELLSSLEAGHPLLALARRPARCEAGQSWRWDGVQFDVLHPLAGDYDRALKSNAMSCVVKVSGPQGVALLTGDIERQQEADLLATQRGALRSDLLLVPHHGSRTSSTAAFVDAVQAQVAVIQSGYRNRFGHPVPEVLDRLHGQGAMVQPSPACGAWRWPGGEAVSAGVCERKIAKRYWHHSLAPD
jgi:competence protein ComEC